VALSDGPLRVAVRVGNTEMTEAHDLRRNQCFTLSLPRILIPPSTDRIELEASHPGAALDYLELRPLP
jgi:hypothetical protein